MRWGPGVEDDPPFHDSPHLRGRESWWCSVQRVRVRLGGEEFSYRVWRTASGQLRVETPNGDVVLVRGDEWTYLDFAAGVPARVPPGGQLPAGAAIRVLVGLTDGLESFNKAFGWLGLSEARQWVERESFDTNAGRPARVLESSGPGLVEIWIDLATGQVLRVSAADTEVSVDEMEDLPVTDKSLFDWPGSWRETS
jgi:hypothetical protein